MRKNEDGLVICLSKQKMPSIKTFLLFVKSLYKPMDLL